MSSIPETYASTRASNQGPIAWLDQYDDVVSLLFDPAHNATVKAHEDASDLIPVAKELKSLLNSSRLGGLLFGYAMQAVLASEVQVLIESGLKPLKEQESLTTEGCRKVRAEIETAVQAVANVDELVERREIMVTYRNWKVPAKVKSITEQIEVSLHAAVDADMKCTEFEFMLKAPVKASREFVWDLRRSKASSGGMTGEQLEAVW
eukprot:1862657-Amphidinium_carterae.1